MKTPQKISLLTLLLGFAAIIPAKLLAHAAPESAAPQQQATAATTPAVNPSTPSAVATAAAPVDVPTATSIVVGPSTVPAATTSTNATNAPPASPAPVETKAAVTTEQSPAMAASTAAAPTSASANSAPPAVPAITSTPKHDEPPPVPGTSWAEAPCPDDVKPADFLIGAREAFAHGDMAWAVYYYNVYLGCESASIDGWGELGNVLYLNGEFRDAAAAYFSAANLLLDKGQFEQALNLMPAIDHGDPWLAKALILRLNTLR